MKYTSQPFLNLSTFLSNPLTEICFEDWNLGLFIIGLNE